MGSHGAVGSGGAEALTGGVENPHFVRVALGDVQNHAVLGEDGAGAARPQQHHRHVLQVWGTQGTPREGMAAGTPPGSPSGSQPTCRGPYVRLAAVRAPRAGAVAVAVDQQHGPLSVRAPRPLGLEEKHQGGTGAGFPPSQAEENPTLGGEAQENPAALQSARSNTSRAGTGCSVILSPRSASSLSWTRLRRFWKLSPSR